MRPNCGSCFYCLHQEPYLCSGAKQDGNLFDGTTRVHKDGQRIFVMSFVGIMAEYAVVPAACVVSIDKSFDFKAAAPLCRSSRGHPWGSCVGAGL